MRCCTSINLPRVRENTVWILAQSAVLPREVSRVPPLVRKVMSDAEENHITKTRQIIIKCNNQDHHSPDLPSRSLLLQAGVQLKPVSYRLQSSPPPPSWRCVRFCPPPLRPSLPSTNEYAGAPTSDAGAGGSNGRLLPVGVAGEAKARSSSAYPPPPP